MPKSVDILRRLTAHMRAFLISRDVLTFCFFCALSTLIWLVHHHQPQAVQVAVPSVNLSTDSVSPIRYTEKTLRMPLESRGVPSGKRMILFAGEVSVTVRVIEEQYRDVTADDFQAVCTYPTHNEDRLPVEVSCSEPHVEILQVTPSEVEYLIQ